MTVHRTALFVGLLLWLCPSVAQAQTRADSIDMLVRAVVELAGPPDDEDPRFLDPRAASEGSDIDRAAFEALEALGFEAWDEGGVRPGIEWWRTGRIGHHEGSTVVTASSWGYRGGDGTLNTHIHTMMYRVENSHGGMVLHRDGIGAIGDGYIAPECVDDYFTRTEDRRGACHRRFTDSGRPPWIRE
ncbi:hypothetical protein [Gaopeijia maritima]|uniref:Uncharacterized protein n=1 Tax=Gaopeijia maritima TaxID=3119007 RepID=A0ABU9E9N5_9BACT